MADVLSAFDKINWKVEVAKVEDPELCSPTVAIETEAGTIWVSGVQSKNGICFISECTFPEETPAFFGLFKMNTMRRLNSESLTPADARRALELFMEGDKHGLCQLYGA
ncbi:MAG: hypothetical protein ACOY4U_11195 [Pseudomonadota bacterium]